MDNTMNIKDLILKQREFDSKHKGNFEWSKIISDENVDILQHLIISLIGEIGEAANIVKKINRGDFKLSDVKEQLSEEVIDILIYTIKLIYQLDIDVEKLYNDKMEYNRNRFKNYEKSNG